MISHYLSFLDHANAHLRDYVFYLSSITACIVFVLVIGALIAFEKPKSIFGAELVWVMIPFVMLFVMMIPVMNIFLYQHHHALSAILGLLNES
ncbi:MAG TPA: hypothetical protein VJK30_00125 [Coxiellaceae bacterium]|nr:MAG: hypothetical protein A3E81_00120 [Gammaproteobacteria bacterium RIFCSPHIGHO2_12_FULL_36_30]HLB55722.1 hypothetical protein [Coxiellaceae bacterium]